MSLKRSAKRAARMAGRFLASAGNRTRRIVLCYHSVHPNVPYASTTPSVFEEHLVWLQQHCRVVSLDDLVNGATPSETEAPAVAITFDDGYEDNHRYALPILLRHGAPATFFVTAGLVEREPSVLARLQRLWRCGPDDVDPLAWQQVRELRGSGMAIGAHGYSHRNLATLPHAELMRELRLSRDIIGDRIGEPIDLFAYPFGKPRVHVTTATVDMTRAAGYRLAASITFRGVPESVPNYTLPRFFADDDTIPKLAAKIRGDYDAIGLWQQHAPLFVIRMVSPQDFIRG